MVFLQRLGRGEKGAGCRVLAGSPRLHEPRLVGEYDELRAVARVELEHRPADVCLGGRGTHDESLGDLTVRESYGDKAHHLALARGDLLEPLRDRAVTVGMRGELVDEPPGDAGRQHGL